MTKQEIIDNIELHIKEKMLVNMPDWLAYIDAYLEALVDAKVISGEEAEYIYNELTL